MFVAFQETRTVQTPARIWFSLTAGADWNPLELTPSLKGPDGRVIDRLPVWSLAIEPFAPHRLYAACDSGVFRSAGSSPISPVWNTWWRGLPPVSVRHIVIHEQRKLLRAATRGRGAWERPLDDDDLDSSHKTAVFVRALRYDDGRFRTKAEVEGEDPIDPKRHLKLLDGVDIKLDVDPVAFGSFQTPSSTVDYLPEGPIDFVGFQALESRTPRRSRAARVYVQVHNAGPDVSEKVKLRLFWSAPDEHGQAFVDSGVWQAFADDSAPTNSDWKPVGPAQVIERVRPAEPRVARFDWDVPGGADRVTLLAIAGDPDPPAHSGMDLEFAQLIPGVSSKSVSLDEPLYKIVGAILIAVGLAALITYALVKEPP